ncbi:MAG: phytanoyl-CoA dioxygenase family protein [Rhodospirillaceae bacterium]
MPGALTAEQVSLYEENGYLLPFDALSTDETQAMLDDLDRFRREEGYSAGDINIKGHLVFRRSYEISRHPRVLDVVEGLIGPNILAFASRFWIKPGSDGSYVSWHQDSAYFGLDPHDLVTVWLALTDSNSENGCLKMLPGSHRGKAHAHIETFNAKNLLARGQSIEGLDDTGAVELNLRAGQFSCHHERIVHGSDANRTTSDRVGLGIFYIPTHVKSTIGRRSACLVRGVDEYGHWDTDPVPAADCDRAILAEAQAAGARYTDPKYRQEAEA